MSYAASQSHLAVLLCCLSCAGGAAPTPAPASGPSGPAPVQTPPSTSDPNPVDPRANGFVCARYRSPTAFGSLPTEVDEASGLAVFGNDEPTFWLHNDSGDLARVYAVDDGGRLLTTLLLDSIIAIDWEDMSRGPCGPDDAQRSCLYIGDIGDNYELRDWVLVHRLPVPEPRPGVQRIVDGTETMRVVYPDRPHDAEALVVDETGRVAIITKDRDGTFSLYSAPFDASGAQVTLDYNATVDISSLPDGHRATATAADYDVLRRRLLVRTYNAAIEFRLEPDQTLVDVGDVPFEIVPTSAERQGESIAYGPDGYWHVSEGRAPPLYFARCDE